MKTVDEVYKDLQDFFFLCDFEYADVLDYNSSLYEESLCIQSYPFSSGINIDAAVDWVIDVQGFCAKNELSMTIRLQKYDAWDVVEIEIEVNKS